MLTIDNIELENDLYSHLVDNHDNVMEVFNKEMNIKSILTQEHYTLGEDGKTQPVRQNFQFFGSGCGISWIEYDKRSSICKKLFDGNEGLHIHNIINRYRSYFVKNMDKDIYEYFKTVGFSVEATLGQNMTINAFILNLVASYLINRFNLKKVWVKTVID